MTAKQVRLASIGLFLILTAVIPAADWPRFLGPMGDGRSAETGLLRRWPADGPAKLWERAVGSGYAGPAVAGGKLILFHRVGDQEIVECLDAKTGAEKWVYKVATGYLDDFNFDDGPRAVAVIADENVYTLGAEARLTCLELATGKKVWDRDLAADYPFRKDVPFKKGFFGVGTGPLVEGDLVIVNVGSKGAGVVAFDRKTGKEAWKASDDEASYSTPVAADIDGKRRAVFLTRAGLLVLDPKDGSIVRQRPFRALINASVNAATPLVADGHIFLSSSYGVGALLLKADGWSEVWKGYESMSNHYTTSVKVGDFLYGCHGRQEEGVALRCIEWATGKLRWEKDRFGCAWLIAADGLLLAIVETGEIVLLAATSEGYRENGRFTAFAKPKDRGKWLRAAPALSDGVLFARDANKLAAWKVAK